MKEKKSFYLLLAIAAILFINGCASTDSQNMSANVPVRSFKDYPDQAFDVKDYIQGMQKGGHNLLYWQDPATV